MAAPSSEQPDDIVSVQDAVRDGNKVYVIANTNHVIPVLFVSEDAGRTWKSHTLPSSYDVVEGVPDGSPGFYALYPWHGQLYMLVDAITFTMQVHYWAVATVDLAANTYRLNGAELPGGRVHFGGGIGLVGLTEHGNVNWQRFDFDAGALATSGSLPMTALVPTGWASADGQVLEAIAERQTPKRELCYERLDTADMLNPLALYCLPRTEVPMSKGAEDARSVPMRGGWGWVTDFYNHAMAMRFTPGAAFGTAAIESFDLGPGKARDFNGETMRPRYGDFVLVSEEPGPPVQRSHLVRIPASGPVEAVSLPRTPCEGGGSCGFGDFGHGYGSVQFVLPMDGGDVLVFHVVNQYDNKIRQLLLVTREHPTFHATSYPALPPGPVPMLPPAQPAGLLDRQCMRAVACGLHSVQTSCLTYWRDVRHGLGGVDTAYAAFLAVPTPPAGTAPSSPAACAMFDGVYPDRRPSTVPCAPGCDHNVATFSCTGSIKAIPIPLRLDCGAFGTTCRTDATGRGLCEDRDITPDECETCVNGVAVRCSDLQAPRMEHCEALGMHCRSDTLNGQTRATCSPGTCTPLNVSRECHGNITAFCAARSDHAILGEQDCSRMGEAAMCVDGQSCDPGGAHCPVERQQLCDHGRAIYCDGGDTLRVLDCRALGFSDCTTTTVNQYTDAVSCVP